MQQVRLFHEILFLPLRCRGNLEQIVGALRGSTHWHDVQDWLNRDAPEPSPKGGTEEFRVPTYAEFAYFHPFVRRSFCAPGRQSPIRLFRRTDVQGLRLEYRSTNAHHVKLNVSRVHLYLFRPEHAVLMLEVHARRAEQLALDMVMELSIACGGFIPPTMKKTRIPKSSCRNG